MKWARGAPALIVLFVAALGSVQAWKHFSDKWKYEQALSQYTQLVESGRPPGDPGYLEVLALLRPLTRVEPDLFPGSRSARPAQQLIDAIEQARKRLPARPLARAANPSDQQDPFAFQRAQCEQLARDLGMTSADTRREAVRRLSGCRLALERLETRSDHSDDPSNAH